MPKFRNFQTNFSGGLLSEGMLGRVDLAQYENGCKQLENWWPKVTGGMRRRPGSFYMNIVADAVRLESFVFNESQTYVVSFCDESGAPNDNIRIFDPLTGTLLDTLNVSWNATTIRELSITQKADVMFLSHPTFKTKRVNRTGASTFTLTDYTFEGRPEDNAYPKKMPFIKFESTEVTITPSGYLKDALVTITASDDIWPSDILVNTAIRYRGKQIMVTGRIGDHTIQGVILEELDQGAVLGFSSTDYRPNDFLVGEILVGRDSGVKCEVISTGVSTASVAMIAGRFAPLTNEEVEGLTSGNIAKITSNSNTNPLASTDWDEEAFSTKRGWPGVIEFHSQRLWLGGSSSLPAHIFGSRSAAFFNFDVGDAFPADSIQVGLAGKQINVVHDIVSGRHLQVFTDAGEFYAPQSEDRPLVPETFDLIPQTRYGSKRILEPKVFDESTIFIQAQGSAIREFIWQDNQKGYSADAISLIAEEHLNDVQELEVLYGGYDRPEQIAFFINGNGNITWYHSARAESIRSWGIWSTQGSYKSLTVVQDKLFALVERNTDTGLQLFLERFELDATLDCMRQWNQATRRSGSTDSVWLDAHIPLNEQNLQVVSGATVDFENDYYLGEFLAFSDTLLEADGIIDITPLAVTNINVGLGFEQTLEIMPIEIKDQQGITTGVPKRIVYADIYMASTLAIQMNGNRVLTFRGEDDLTVKPEPITGLRKFYSLGYSERPTVIVENDIPLPCEALAIGAEVEY